MRVIVSSVGLTGHALPALALARALRDRGHSVMVETSERWRAQVEDFGGRFIAATEGITPPGGNEPTRLNRSSAGPGTSIRAAVEALAEPIEAFAPRVLVSDLFTLAPALAAERAGVRRASLLHHAYPDVAPGQPPFPSGFRRPRTPAGAALWAAVRPRFDPRHHRGRRQLNDVRAEIGLPPLERFFGSISDQLALVATFPQLEYSRRWPAHVHVTGPMFFERAQPPVELPPGDGPLVVVVTSSGQPGRLRLLEIALEAFADEPVRVLASTSEIARVAGGVPPNARVVKWVPFADVLPQAALVITNGGHGTVVSALAAGVPVLVCPSGADQPENGIRVSSAGAGLMLPRRLLGMRPLRVAARRILGDPSFAQTARRFADWSSANDGAQRGAELLERHLGA